MSRLLSSIRRDIWISIAGILTIVVTVYSYILIATSFKTMDDHLGEELRAEIRVLAEKYQQTGTLNMNPYPDTLTYLASKGLPEWLQQLVDDGKLAPDYPYIEQPVSEDKNGTEASFIFIPVHENNDRIYLVYYSTEFNEQTWETASQAVMRSFLTTIIPAAVVMILLILLVAGRLLRRLSGDALKLSEFAACGIDQTCDTQSDIRDSLNYQENQKVASTLKNSLLKIQALASREQQFLRNASHELRTPIAITRASLDILEHQGCLSDPKASAPWQRINRANRNMQLLTETLLWLGSEKSAALPEQPCDLQLLISEICDEHQYLLTGKPVSFEMDVRCDHEYTTTVQLLRIVLANLIRNSCQYTDEGFVRIVIDDQRIIVEDSGSGFAGSENQPENEGFGLGLNLALQIVEQQGWQLDISSTSDGGAKVTLNF